MQTLKQMYAHLHWANQQIFETLQKHENVPPQVLDLFSHILFSEKIWITRLQGGDTSQMPIWSPVSLDVCIALVKQNKESFTSILQSLTQERYNQTLSYTNSKGITFTNSVQEILTHVALHGQYHRGQINTRLRMEGLEPMNTDFITFVR